MRIDQEIVIIGVLIVLIVKTFIKSMKLFKGEK